MSLSLGLVFLCSCSSSGTPWGDRQDVDGGPPDLPTLENPREQDGKVIVRVANGQLPHLGGHITHLAAGPRTLLVVYAEPSEQQTAPEPIALWLRGRKSSRSRLPQFTSGLVNPGNSQDWHVDLLPGDYLLSITLGANTPGEVSSTAHILAR